VSALGYGTFAATPPAGRDWEATLRAWAKPPSDTEDERCENATRMIQDALRASRVLALRTLEVFVHGSYRNNTNVRLGSDVDVCVRCMDAVYPDYTFAGGATNATFGYSDSSYGPAALKSDVEAALRAHFGRLAVHRGNKVLQLHENTYRVSADVATTFERRRYHRRADGGYWYESGTMLITDDGQRIENWPHQHYENGTNKNLRTKKRFRAVVRILKRLRDEIEVRGGDSVPVPSFLIESLVWNAPDACFGHASYSEDVRLVLAYLMTQLAQDATCHEWGEVNERKYLFRGSQAWTRAQASTFVITSWCYLGFA
jgi:hypothetical protein